MSGKTVSASKPVEGKMTAAQWREWANATLDRHDVILSRLVSDFEVRRAAQLESAGKALLDELAQGQGPTGLMAKVERARRACRKLATRKGV